MNFFYDDTDHVTCSFDIFICIHIESVKNTVTIQYSIWSENVKDLKNNKQSYLKYVSYKLPNDHNIYLYHNLQYWDNKGSTVDVNITNLLD